ncbi:glycoside hydrolase family 3 N-terminal domain-containing protein [Agilicoccus flavus]|uniref:glycoside hydrolase family 3 N-terminal domain-containing protein n=1 Tax=Agilicoccus flavus TaxID=2775968 RepID=UPI001CF6427E|nr:glycoside hydrolase family 3 N-terminal domain-containing protein [Agilicoccus flavus]
MLTLGLSAACAPAGDPAPAGSASGRSSTTAGTAGTGAPGPGATAPTTPPAPGTAGRAPGPDDLAAARRDVAKLPLERLAAQLVVPRQAGSARDAAARLRDVGYGGVAVFREDLPAGAAAVPAARSANAAFARATTASGRSWPPFVSVDQEGGPVTRIDAPLTRFPALMALGAAGDPELARAVGVASGAELVGLGFTVVMAPSADVTTGPDDPTIGVRSAGSDPAAVGRLSTALALGYLEAGVLPTLKHFPGHGSVTADTHVGTARQDASRATLLRRDLAPFRAGIEAGVPAVMTAHIVLTAVDRDRPATLSPAVLDGLLRRDLGFRGLVVTDALEMGAVAQRFGADRAAVLAVGAGADVLLMPADPRAAVSALVAATRDGTLTRARLEESAARMVAALRVAAAPASPQDRAPGSHADVAARLAAASVVQLSGRCGARLVGRSVRVTGGRADDRAAFTAAARRAGLGVGSGTHVALLDGGAYRAGEGEGGAGGDGDAGRSGAGVVVALDVPYGLAGGAAGAARLATFGRTPATFDALVAVLTGRAPARGRLPVAVGARALGSGCEGAS